MKRPCLFVRRWRGFALLLVPFLAWGIVLAVVPTGWARNRLVARMEKATGRSVSIGALRLGVLGELRIINLAIAEPSTPTNPWLRADEARIDVHLGQVFCGHCDPKEVEVEGVTLRIWRKQDGTPEVGDLFTDGNAPARGRSKAVQGESHGTMEIKVTGAKIQVVDDASGNQLEISDVAARGTWGVRQVWVEELRGKVNGGTFAMAAKLDRDPGCPRFEAEVQAIGVEIDRGMPVLGYFMPVVAGSTERVGGKFNLRLALKGQGATRAEVVRSCKGHGSVALDPIDLAALGSSPSSRCSATCPSRSGGSGRSPATSRLLEGGSRPTT